MSEQQNNPTQTGQGSVISSEDAMPRHRNGSLYRITGQINRSTLLMGLMFAVGLGWVIWESQQISMPDADTENAANSVIVDSGIEAMARHVNTLDKDSVETEALIQAFYYEPQQRQIALENLRQNPFGVKEEIVEITTTVTINPPEEVKPEPPKPKAPPVDKLNLQSVVLSDPPSAMISGAIVTQGQVINGWKIVLIERRQVTLKWRDETHVLKMEK